jgi:hypothetical protein
MMRPAALRGELKMNRLIMICYIAGLALALSIGTAYAEGKNVERMGEGTVDAVTAPGKVVEGIAEDTKEHGPVVGTVTGTTKGAVKGAAKVVEGGAKIGVGAVETGAEVVKKVLEPITGE